MDAPSQVSRLHDSRDYSFTESVSVDRLSELPNSLTLVILSLLEMRDVVRTTILSKRWKDLWTTVPCLHFDTTYYSNLCVFFVCKALLLWRGSQLLKFSLTISIDNYGYLSCDIVDLWVRFAIENQVEELYRNSKHSRVEYYAPSCICSCSSIKKLTLISCKLKDEETVQWDQLVSLRVEGAETLSENAFNHVFFGAPQLEVLNLFVMGFDENLNIKSSSLKVVKIRRFDILYIENGPMLRIDAPNLKTLVISGVMYPGCLLNVPSLNNVVLDICYRADTAVEEILKEVFLSIRHVEKIILSSCCTEALYEMEKKDMLLPFSNAKFVKFSAKAAHKILDVVEMFPQLRMLVVVCKWDGSNDSHVNALEPRTNFSTSILLHLRKVEVTWLVLDALIYPVIEILLKNAGVLERMVFRPIWFEDLKSMFEAEEKVLSMPRSSPTAEVIVINDW